MNHIELFAGCGGLSLGLETAGFELILANELSPMAAETFAFNHMNVDFEKNTRTEKVFWISSQFSRENITFRLRENPILASGLEKEHVSDLVELNPSTEDLSRSLLIGSIIDLNKILSKRNSKLKKQLCSGLGRGEVDLISGGPPCQSFSLAGLRQHENERNQLPWEFAKFVKIVQPKMALLENVSGILRPFKVDGKKHYAWHEIAKSFAKIGYIPFCLHVNAKFVGAAQNRPRFIMLSFRPDIFNKIGEKIEDLNLLKALQISKKFFDQIRKGIEPEFGSIKYYEIEKDNAIFENEIFSRLKTHDFGNLVSVKSAIDDLRTARIAESDYVKVLNSTYKNHYKFKANKWKNHDPRNNNNKVKARFRIYQIMSKISKLENQEVSNFLKDGGSSSISIETLKSISRYWILDMDGAKIIRPSANTVLELLGKIYTKKRTQKALLASLPAPAALSIPDDACHYHESIASQRTLTVREMARIQSFPDWFEIKSKVTTGGNMRKFEVPQYTQIGNAVPPLLGVALGEVCRKLLEYANEH
tara:strand:+ start:27 stop:1625 length:1599 start_codon:yes stop_codon:yes gene_type:complete